MIRTCTTAIPRVLADDLCLWAQEDPSDRPKLGEDQKHHQNFRAAVQLTLLFLKHMGAKVAYTKCVTMASSPQARKWLRAQKWGDECNSMPVVHHVRDLGARFNSTSKRIAGTMRARFQEAACDVMRISRLPRGLRAIGMMIAATMHSKALYGIQAGTPCIQDLRYLSSCCTNALVGAHPS